MSKSMTVVHPATKFDYSELETELNNRVANKLIRSTQNDDGLRIYTYAESCVFDRLWDDFTLIARGLILDTKNKRIAALPFPKFFNHSESVVPMPDLPFETYEKLDGSLAIIYHYNGDWRVATKGSLNSIQAQMAKRYLDTLDTKQLVPGTTYLTEYVGPQNRIVIPYEKEALVLLGAYDEGGFELPYEGSQGFAYAVGFENAKRYEYNDLSELVEQIGSLPKDEEGFVLRFENGFRCKIKGDAYLRIHRLISNCTPLSIWDAMYHNEDLTRLRKELPEEFWPDFDTIISILTTNLNDIVDNTKQIADDMQTWSDKQVGLSLGQISDPYRSFIFPYRKSNGKLLDSKARYGIFKAIRPDSNHLKGYIPSCSMNRVYEENN